MKITLDPIRLDGYLVEGKLSVLSLTRRNVWNKDCLIAELLTPKRVGINSYEELAPHFTQSEITYLILKFGPLTKVKPVNMDGL